MNVRVLANPRQGTPGMVVLPAGGYQRAKRVITAWPGYAPTPLHDLPGLAEEAGVGVLRIKDESPRFGLGSFKALGGAYAVLHVALNALARAGVAATPDDLLQGRRAAPEVTVTCATDGNHGRSVAWGARRIGVRAVIFVHQTVSAGRVAAIAGFGAEVRRVRGTYDDAVRAASAAAANKGWTVVSDTSWPGYTEIAREVMQGYRMMADEALDQWQGPPPTHVLVQGGVGGAAAAVSVQLRARLDPAPALVVVEPDRAACLLASAEAGRLTAVGGALDTVMAGLACGEPSLLAWQELERAAHAFVAIPDEAAIHAMRRLHALGIISGESGAAGLGALLAGGAAMGLGPDSRVLLFSTEGATDPDLYTRLVA